MEGVGSGGGHGQAVRAQLIVLHVVPYEPMSEALRAFAEAEHMPAGEEEGRYHYARTLGDHLTRSAEARARDRGPEQRRRTHGRG